MNKGNEASVYLKYIIDNYDNLPDFTFFIHDEEYAWHHTGSIIDKYTESIMSNSWTFPKALGSNVSNVAFVVVLSIICIILYILFRLVALFCMYLPRFVL